MAEKVKATVKKTVAAKEVKPVEAKVEAKAVEAPKAVAAPKAEPAKKAEAPKKAAAPKKAPAKKATETKAAAPKKTAVKTNVVIEVADRKYSSADIEKIAKDVWVYDLGKKAAELKSMELYVKAEEANVYYVFNGDIQGVFGI
ncbi:MAG: DUF6465 family protein [Lachnospiraceae bacterium]|nr:DUF6465 family protein [Lachnospiraceae bacterium]MDY5000600.1 DUF6465 family protein [Lachnospiraceae bacterium]